MKISAALCALAAVLVCSTPFAAGLAEPVPACEERMGRVLSDFATIVPGVTTKADVQRLLRQDGGAFSPRTMRFVHPLCAYCKVEVTFNATRDSEGRLQGSDSDVVVQVSKPYLETLFID
jgi:hypothetical protein